MSSLWLNLLQNIHGYLSGDSSDSLPHFQAWQGRKAVCPGNGTEAVAWESGRRARDSVHFVKSFSQGLLWGPSLA